MLGRAEGEGKYRLFQEPKGHQTIIKLFIAVQVAGAGVLSSASHCLARKCYPDCQTYWPVA